MKAKQSALDDSTVMTPREVGEWLRVKPRQLERLGVPCMVLSHKVRRYLKGDVLSWLQQQRKAS